MMSCMYGTLKALYFVVVLLKRIRYSHEKKCTIRVKKRAKIKKYKPEPNESLKTRKHYQMLEKLYISFSIRCFFLSEFNIVQYFCYIKNQRLQEYIKENRTTQVIELHSIRQCRITLHYGFKNTVRFPILNGMTTFYRFQCNIEHIYYIICWLILHGENSYCYVLAACTLTCFSFTMLLHLNLKSSDSFELIEHILLHS